MDAHNELLDRWSVEENHIGKGFIRDGIIDPARWESSSCKVLLLLKEAYDAPDKTDGFDLCELIRDKWQGPKNNIWWNAAYWCLAAQSLGVPPPLPSDQEGYAAATNALLTSSIVNIKKSDGLPFSNSENLKKYADKDKEYIKKQIEMINPRIVICGYTWEYVKDFWSSAVKISDLVYVAGGRVFIDYWHPANQYPHKLNYYAFAFLLQQAQRAEPQLFV